jgi:DNA-binding HxlR family transcriptional regulator
MYCQISDRSVRLKENTIWEEILCGLFHGTRTNIILYREAIKRLFFSENILNFRIKKVIESITQKFLLETLRERVAPELVVTIQLSQKKL